MPIVRLGLPPNPFPIGLGVCVMCMHTCVYVCAATVTQELLHSLSYRAVACGGGVGVYCHSYLGTSAPLLGPPLPVFLPQRILPLVLSSRDWGGGEGRWGGSLGVPGTQAGQRGGLWARVEAVRRWLGAPLWPPAKAVSLLTQELSTVPGPSLETQRAERPL